MKVFDIRTLWTGQSHMFKCAFSTKNADNPRSQNVFTLWLSPTLFYPFMESRTSVVITTVVWGGEEGFNIARNWRFFS